jgi:DNA-binding NtrC family response regulator
MKPISILLVDDDDIFRMTIQEFLSLKGYSIISVENGSRAYEQIRSRDFDVVLLDVNMPKMDGIETIRAIKERRPGIRVVIISGDTDHAAIQYALSCGASDFLQKPFEMDELVECLESLNAPAIIKK